jgi:hypothetical protein
MFNADLRAFVKNAVQDLNPLTVRQLFMVWRWERNVA